MIIKILFLSLVATIFVTAEIQLHPTSTDDLQEIVESVKNDVDGYIHLLSKKMKLTNAGETSNKESMVFEESSTEDYEVMLETSNDGNSEENSEYLSDGVEAYYGSAKGRPGVDFPDYTDIPKTSFTCQGKTMHPSGFYADMDTGCQVFHVCWPDRRESFLCPMGTTFNQVILACDYWYNSNCSLASFYYTMDSSKSEKVSMINIPVHKTNYLPSIHPATITFFVSEFMPVKAKVVIYPKTETQREKIVVSATAGESKESKSRKRTRHSKHSRVPRSIDSTSSSTQPLNVLKSKISIYRSWEAMNKAIEEIRNNETTAHLVPSAERIQQFIKTWFLEDETPLMVHFEPDSELEKHDIAKQKGVKNVTLVLKQLMDMVAWFMYDDTEDRKSSKDFLEAWSEEDLHTLKDEPLTALNPRFIVKPAATKMQFNEQGSSSSLEKPRIKRATPTLNPLKLLREDSINIRPETKAALLKSYVKLFKAKHA